jgi:hypothetical protein
MRIDYTLPGLDLGLPSELPASTEIQAPRTFRDDLRGVAPELPVTWQQHMGLDARPMDATFIGPPPPPRSLEVGDAGTERMRWRKMLSQHDAELSQSGNSDGAEARQSIRMMLDMLQSLQNSQDSLVSLNAAVTRG